MRDELLQEAVFDMVEEAKGLAERWAKPRRVVAKVEHHQGELFPCVGFIVTNMNLPSRAAVRFYNKTNAGRRSSGSRKASKRRIGPSCRAIASERTKCGCNSAYWLQPGQSLAAAGTAATN